jgi:hypothetical protein
MMQRMLVSLAVVTAFGGSAYALVPRPKVVLASETMYAVDEAFLGYDIAGIPGDDLPWTFTSVRWSLTDDSHLTLSVHGLVFTDDDMVPPRLRGINDEAYFRAAVSCTTQDDAGNVSQVNTISRRFPATRTGNGSLSQTLDLPADCIAPIVMILSGSEDDWFAVSGAELD